MAAEAQLAASRAAEAAAEGAPAPAEAEEEVEAWAAAAVCSARRPALLSCSTAARTTQHLRVGLVAVKWQTCQFGQFGASLGWERSSKTAARAAARCALPLQTSGRSARNACAPRQRRVLPRGVVATAQFSLLSQHRTEKTKARAHARTSLQRNKARDQLKFEEQSRTYSSARVRAVRVRLWVVARRYSAHCLIPASHARLSRSEIQASCIATVVYDMQVTFPFLRS